MLEVTLSEQYQVVIPKEIRDSLHLKAGQKFSIVLKGDSITLVPACRYWEVTIKPPVSLSAGFAWRIVESFSNSLAIYSNSRLIYAVTFYYC